MGYMRLLWELYRLKKNVTKSAGQIKKQQQKELRKLLRYAYRNSAYYRRTFEKAGISEKNIDRIPLKKIPVMNKELLMQYYDELVTDPKIRQEDLQGFDESSESKSEKYLGKYHVAHSSGSTGTPRYFVYDEEAWNRMLSGIVRGALWGMGMPDILKLLAGRPAILYIAATDGRYGGAMAVGDGIRGVGARQEYLDISEPMDTWIKKVVEFRPDIVIGYPSAMKLLAEQMRQKHVRCRFRRIVSCGEPLTPGLRIFLENTFQCPVINFYGSSESLALGLEEKAGEGIVLFDDLNIIEVEDGEMYLTCLYNFTQPLIRYHLTDKLELRDRKQKDRYGFSRADVLLCRSEDVMWFTRTDGTKEFIHPLSIEGICVDGLKDYQFVQMSETSFEIRAEKDGSASADDIRTGVEQLLKPLLLAKGLEEIRFRVRFVETIIPDEKTGKKQLIQKQWMQKQQVTERCG